MGDKELPRVGHQLASCSLLISYVLMSYIANKGALDHVSHARGKLSRGGQSSRKAGSGGTESCGLRTAILALPVVWWSLTFAVLEGAAPRTEGVESVLKNEVRRVLFTITGRRETGKDGD